MKSRARVEERVHIHSTVEHVWAVLTDWESQPRWMQDAQEVRVTSPHRRGVGVTIACPTDIAPGIVVVDEMEVTDWVEQRRIAVRHTGKVIRGHGAFELHPSRRPGGAEGTIFTWWEVIDTPLGALGRLIADYTIVPYVSRIFRRSLRALKSHVEAGAPA